MIKRGRRWVNKLNQIVYTQEKEYVRRSYLLKVMGFKSYKEYLKSGRWKRVCHLSFSKQNKCSICGNKENLVPHHLMYTKRNLSGIDSSWVVVICQSCHSIIHEIEKTAEITPLKATLIYLEVNYPETSYTWIKKPEDFVSLTSATKGSYRKYGVFGLRKMGLI